jgi:hypothetical protein
MNKYQAQVKVSGFSLKTIVYADSATHARLLLQQQFGANNVLTSPVKVG